MAATTPIIPVVINTSARVNPYTKKKFSHIFPSNYVRYLSQNNIIIHV